MGLCTHYCSLGRGASIGGTISFPKSTEGLLYYARKIMRNSARDNGKEVYVDRSIIKVGNYIQVSEIKDATK